VSAETFSDERPVRGLVALPAVSPARRDVALDLLRGLAMVILVVNHIHLDSALEYATEPFLSAAETLVAVSGVVAGMVFGRRWQMHGPRGGTLALLRRSRRLYLASVTVVAIIGALALIPGSATQALTVPPSGASDLYAYDGLLRTALAIVTLEAGPWQFNILGLFVAALATAPAVLGALERGWCPAVLAASWTLYLIGRQTQVDVLPSQSEGPFPVLIWQVLFVHGMVLGWHRERVAAALRATRGAVAAAVVVVALLAAYLRLHEIGLDPLGLDRLVGYGPADWRRWDAAHFSKATLDPARLVTMVSLAAAAYLALRRLECLAVRTIGRVLLPLGRNSFYVFIMHVFVCLAVATLPPLAGDGLGIAGNTVAQLGCLALLWVMVRRRFLFRWVPR
jgi:hypothetical protein